MHHRSKTGVPDARPIVLIGPMAVGKSAIGYQLAQQLGAPFVDTDVVIVGNHGSIAEIGRRLEVALREFAAAKQEVEK